MNLNQLAHALQIDLSSALSRFAGNKALYVKFLKKFIDDPTFSKLAAAISENNLAETERSAHTLKGVAANLGLAPLSQHCGALVQAVRDEQPSSIPSLFALCQQEYETIKQALQQLE